MTQYNNTIRCALLSEIPALNEIIKISSKALSDQYYNHDEISGLNQYVFGADSELIADQSYFVVERDGIIIACGGWSRRKTLFGGDQCSDRSSGYLDPSQDAAKIRAFFIHADYARQGLGSLLMNHCEDEARKHGFQNIELMSTLPGIPFYEKHGFIGTELVNYTLPNGIVIKLKPMTKSL
jgi:GNAT superfamily N-acetyltransferase